MASFLLGDEYASSSSSEDEETTPTVKTATKGPLPTVATSNTPILPSADELFASDTSSVLSTSVSSTSAPSHKRKNEQVQRAATKAVKTETGEASRKLKIAPFAPPQLRRPNVSTEDRSSWNTNKTMTLQRRAKEAEAREM
ncbi:hypothetical protein P3T76_004128 [Phytophthora citrophthora]|uniref:Uncharacterized protein n=1 Tax=Phytophthora citrophthora TaxID=4793 RepID=A0AAD9GTK2_9STRA|nr:hypothetical protein P3T76_004128 [Phytophthora citrophthora]